MSNAPLRLAALCVLLIGSILVAACGSDDAAGEEPDVTIEVLEPIIPEPPTPDIAAAYMVIQNHQEQADRLTGISSPAADVLELHESRMENGIATMVGLEVMEIPGGGALHLEHGSYHVMLIDLTEPLAEGDEVPLTLHFERAGDVEVTASVVPSTGLDDHGDHEGH